MYVCVSALKKLGMFGRRYNFILSEYFIQKLQVSLHFHPFFSIFDNTLLKIQNKMFRVGAKT